MDGDTLIRDGLEVLIVIAVGGMLVNVLRRFRRGELEAYLCPSCGRPTSNAFARCRWCDEPLPD